MVLPAFSGLAASVWAARRAAPEEMPVRMPSVLASSWAAAKASSSVMVRISS